MITIFLKRKNLVTKTFQWMKFRNALVRANYNDLKNGIHETTEYVELFLRNLLLGEQNELLNRNMHISVSCKEKVDIDVQKVDIDVQKVDIQSEINNNLERFSNKTISHIKVLYRAFGRDIVFGRSNVEMQTGLKSSGASKLIKQLLDANIIVPVKGFGKGKYRFNI